MEIPEQTRSMDRKKVEGWLDNLANNEDWTADGMRLYAKEALDVLQASKEPKQLTEENRAELIATLQQAKVTGKTAMAFAKEQGYEKVVELIKEERIRVDACIKMLE